MATSANKKNVNLNLDITLWQQLSEIAKKENRSLSNLVCTVLKNFIENENKSK